MTRTLQFSLAANALLGVALTFSLVGSRSDTAAPEVKEHAASPPLAPSMSPGFSVPFSWAEVEAESYPAYIANLRRIGCPEQTIRDIIAADLNANAALAAAPTSPRESVTSEVQVQLFHSLFGDPSDPVDQPAALAWHGAVEPLPELPRLPALLAEPAAGLLTDEQGATVAALREEFIASVGGANQNASDPTYLTRWQAAQPLFDERLRTLLGWRVYQNLQVSVAALELE